MTCLIKDLHVRRVLKYVFTYDRYVLAYDRYVLAYDRYVFAYDRYDRYVFDCDSVIVLR